MLFDICELDSIETENFDYAIYAYYKMYKMVRNNKITGGTLELLFTNIDDAKTQMRKMYEEDNKPKD